MDYEWLAPVMFITVLVLIFTGYPVAFSLGGTAILFAGLGVALDVIRWPYVFGMFERCFGIVSNNVLLAIPYFIFMGTMLEKSKLAEDLLETIGQLFGPVRGGLAMAVVVVGALLAAATGVIGASVVAMGMISLPVMLRYHYKHEVATGIIAASGTLGQIIPPSVVLVVLADQIGTSVGDLFRGALVPGLLLSTLFAGYIGFLALAKPASVPALPLEARGISGFPLFKKSLLVMLPPLLLILLVLGSIFTGLATPTEAGSLGALGSIVLVLLNRRMTRKALVETMRGTTLMTCMVMFLLIGSTAFTLVFRLYGGADWIEHILTNLPGGVWGAIIIANLVIFFLGFFIDFFEIAFIVVPLLAPVFVETLGLDPVWFGVMVAMNLQTSFLTPPFGFALFYLKGVCPPHIKTTEIYRGVVPFIIIQLVALVLVIVFPKLVTSLV